MTDSTLELVRIRRNFFFSEDMLRCCTTSCAAFVDCALGEDGVGSGDTASTEGVSCAAFVDCALDEDGVGSGDTAWTEGGSSPVDSVRGSMMFVSASSTVIIFGPPSPPSRG